MAVREDRLHTLIEEYLKLDENLKGEPLEAKERSLAEIVKYLNEELSDKQTIWRLVSEKEVDDNLYGLYNKFVKTTTDEDGNDIITGYPEFEQAVTSAKLEDEYHKIQRERVISDSKEPRATNDRVRRYLDKLVAMRKITKTGKTINTKYTYNPGQTNRNYKIFTDVEKLGGVAKEKDLPYYQKYMEYGFREPDDLQRKKDIDKREFPRGFQGMAEYETAKFDLQRNVSLSDDKGKRPLQEKIESPFSIDKERIYTNHSNYWFEKKSYHSWMPKSFFGFQGPIGLNEIIANITQNIENLPPKYELSNKIEEIQKNLAELEQWYSEKKTSFPPTKIDTIREELLEERYLSKRKRLQKNLENIIHTRTLDEILMIKESNKPKSRRYSNRIIITLALLHLNRSLQAQFNP